MLASLRKIFIQDKTYTLNEQLSEKDMYSISMIDSKLNKLHIIAYKNVSKFLMSKIYLFTANALYINKNTKISFLGLLDIQRNGKNCIFTYISESKNYVLDDELYAYVQKVFDVRQTFIKEADALVYGDNKNVSTAISLYAQTLVHDMYRKEDATQLDNIGFYYWNKRHFAHAIAYYLRAQKLNDWVAYFNVGLAYQYGYDVEKDYTKALELYKKALSLNPDNVTIQLQLGWLYNDMKEYSSMHMQFLLYGYDNPEVCNHLGWAYLQGLGERKDFKQAKRYFKKAAEKDSKYYYGLAVACKEADEPYNYFSYAKKSHEAKHFLSHHLMAVAYKDGLGVKQNVTEAEYHFENAMKNAKGRSDIIYNYACFYKELKHDYESAYDLFVKGMELGHANCCLEIAKMYYNGNYVEKDEDKAKEYVNKAAEMANLDFRCMMAQMYIDGDSVAKNIKHAEVLLAKVLMHDKNKENMYHYFKQVIDKKIKPYSFPEQDLYLMKEQLYKQDYRVSEEDKKAIDDAIHEVIVERYGDDWEKMEKLFLEFVYE